MPHNRNMDIDPQGNTVKPEIKESAEDQNRRELISKLGKFAIYAAPFTVMAINSQAATSSGPHKHP
jgi:hypothetical protein